nr:uncharacterized protein LOC107450434 [Parasteatoda tepidariorum]
MCRNIDIQQTEKTMLSDVNDIVTLESSSNEEQFLNFINQATVVILESWLVANGDAAGTLKFVYQPIFSYCNEVLISTAASTIQKLDIEQNQALRTITGTIRFTPILAMQCLTGNPPVRSIIERDAILLYERLIRLPNNTFCRDYDTNAKRNLKTQGDFLQYAFPAANDINVHLNPKRLYRPVCPLSYGGISVCLSLDRQVNKCHMRDQQLRAIALSTIENKFPGHTWLHVYTDGSMFSDEDGAGAGVYCDLLSCYSPIGAHSPHYDGEIEAIYIALKQLANHSSSFCTVVTLSDFTSALESFADRQYNTLDPSPPWDSWKRGCRLFNQTGGRDPPETFEKPLLSRSQTPDKKKM